MKKVISILLTAVLLFSISAVALTSSADSDNITFTVATDIHAKEEGAVIKHDYPENELYFHAENTGNLYCEAVGILMNCLEQSVESGAEFILIPGDATNSGTGEQHKYIASILENFEKESGIPIYVIPGNHDYFNSDPADFKNYYNELCYKDALTVDSETASYTADLPGNYRLIAIDSNDPGEHGDGLDDRLFSWIEEQAKAAHDEGKVIISMMHHPLLEPIPYAELLMGDFIVENHEDVAEKFTQYGIQYVFTGHEHGNNVSCYKGSNGKTVYDVLTTALTSYPLEYRLVNMSSEGMDIKMQSVDECNFDYVGEGYTEAQLKLMEEDYTEYSYGYFKYSIEKKIAKYITPEFIKDKLDVEDGALADAIDAVMPLVEESLQMPLYSKDTDGQSVEALANAAGVELPESDYYNLYDLATTAVARVYYGAENMPFDSSPEGKVLIIGLNTMLKYILAQAGNKTASLALNSIMSAVGIDKTFDLNIYRWNTALVLNSDKSYEIAFSVLEPILTKFIVDDEWCDRDVTLPAPDETVEVEDDFSKFTDKLFAFFSYIFNIVKTALSLPF